jgi:ArsR family transcriptional regulator, arsenate/arsenite/antimonite-responsive transcriptional repressor
MSQTLGRAGDVQGDEARHAWSMDSYRTLSERNTVSTAKTHMIEANADQVDVFRSAKYIHPDIRISENGITMTTSPPLIFRALADRTRLRIVNLLGRGSLCVCDIQRILEQPQSSVSRHLALLKSAGLIADRRDGMRTFYRLTVWQGGLARGILAVVRGHLAVEGDYLNDLEELTELRARGECHEEPKPAQRRPSTNRRSAAVLET